MTNSVSRLKHAEQLSTRLRQINQGKFTLIIQVIDCVINI